MTRRMCAVVGSTDEPSRSPSRRSHRAAEEVTARGVRLGARPRLRKSLRALPPHLVQRPAPTRETTHSMEERGDERALDEVADLGIPVDHPLRLAVLASEARLVVLEQRTAEVAPPPGS